VASHWTLKEPSPDSPRLQINTDITGRKSVEEALRKSEERYRRFVDQDLTGDLFIRPDGSIITCNPAFVRIFGFASTEEALGANFLALFRSRKETAELLTLLRRQGTIDRHELELRRPGAEAVYVVARLVGAFNAAGELTEAQVYLFLTIRNASASSNSSSRRRRWRASAPWRAGSRTILITFSPSSSATRARSRGRAPGQTG